MVALLGKLGKWYMWGQEEGEVRAEKTSILGNGLVKIKAVGVNWLNRAGTSCRGISVKLL